MIYFYYLKDYIYISKDLSTIPNDGILLAKHNRKLSQTYNAWLRPYKASNDSFKFSEQLLRLISRIVKKDYEDLWNLIFLRSDRSKRSAEEFFSSREEELVLQQLGIFKYDV